MNLQKKIMNKFLSFFGCLALILTLNQCSKDSKDKDNNEAVNTGTTLGAACTGTADAGIQLADGVTITGDIKPLIEVLKDKSKTIKDVATEFSKVLDKEYKPLDQLALSANQVVLLAAASNKCVDLIKHMVTLDDFKENKKGTFTDWIQFALIMGIKDQEDVLKAMQSLDLDKHNKELSTTMAQLKAVEGKITQTDFIFKGLKLEGVVANADLDLATGVKSDATNVKMVMFSNAANKKVEEITITTGSAQGKLVPDFTNLKSAVDNTEAKSIHVSYIGSAATTAAIAKVQDYYLLSAILGLNNQAVKTTLSDGVVIEDDAIELYKGIITAMIKP